MPRKKKLVEPSLIVASKDVRPEDLPHLYGLPWYKWQWDFFNDTSKNAFLCSANQVGKSSVLIRKVIHWATCPELWPQLWKSKPTQFWYFYPNKDIATTEFSEKWEKEFMPRGAAKDHPLYGWEKNMKFGSIHDIKFNSGISIYFKSYEQALTNIQGSSVYFIACFVKGTLITTPDGLRDIADLKVGDLVLSHDGKFHSIEKIYFQTKSVITREFSNGEKITATPDHPFYVEGHGWKDFGELTPDDECVTHFGWKTLKKLSNLKERFTTDYPMQKIIAKEIISKDFLINIFMLKFGNFSINRVFQAVALFTIKILIRSTMKFIIWNCLLEQSTQEYIKRKSGSQKNTKKEFAKSAKNHLPREALKKRLKDFVQIDVVGYIFLKFVPFVKSLLRRDIVLNRERVLKGVEKVYQSEVFNISVSSSHTYFAQSFQVHNCDEELPHVYWSETSARRDGLNIDGYFNMAFTATLSQRFWYEAMECIGLPEERFRDAKKIQVSLYDCQQYMDGTKTGWTNERIQKRIDSCQSEKEVLRRVMGRFVNEELSIISGFSEEQNYKHGEFIVPSTWSRIISFYVSSVGTGICVLAVSAEFDKVVVAECHKLDLTSYEALEKLHALRGKKSAELYINAEPLDFVEMSQNSGIFFQTVKNPKNGLKDKINSYFKTGVLEIAKSKNSHELIMQIRTIKESDVKSYEGYEVYGAMAIGLSKLAVSLQNSIEGVKKKVPPKILNEREAFYRGLDRPLEVVDSYDNEFDEMNELLESF